MASKMVLRRQTGHICTECKESFRAKELLLEHYELVHPTKHNIYLKSSDSKIKLNSSSEANNEDDVTDSTTPPVQAAHDDDTEKQEGVLRDEEEEEEVMREIKVEAVEELERDDEVPVVDDGICAFEVIEEVVDGNEVLQEVMTETGSKKLLRRRRSTPMKDPSHNNQSVYSLCLAAEIASSMEQVQAAQSLLGMSQKEIEEGAEGGDEKMAALLSKKQADNNIIENKTDKHTDNNDNKKEKACNINLASKISFLQSLNKRITSGGKQSNESKLSSLITAPLNNTTSTNTPLSPLNNTALKMVGGKLTGDTLKDEDLNITIGGNRYKIEQAMVEKNKNSFVIYEDQRQIHFPVSNNNLNNNLNNNKFMLHNNKIIINNNRGAGYSNRGRGGNNNNMKIVNNNNTRVIGNNNMQDAEMIPVTQEIEVVTDCIKVETDTQQQHNNYSFNKSFNNNSFNNKSFNNNSFNNNNNSFNNNNNSFNNNNNNNPNDSYVIQLVNNNNNTSLNNMQQQRNNNNNVVPNQPNYRSSVDASLSSLGLNVNPRNQPLNDVKDGKIYMCGLCNKTYSDCEFLKTHVEKHSGLEKQAGKTGHLKEEKFTDDSDEENTTTTTPSSPTRHQCRECGEKFSRLAFLKKHAKAEHGQLKAYVCGACNKSFPFACGLKLHALTHGAERRYSCQFCGRRFKHASNLQKHVKVVHVNTCKCRTVECVCGKRDPSSFKIDHACHICGRVCESSKHLEIHYRSHTGEKPEVCQICGKSFQHKSNLQKHQLKHTGIRPYQCPHCQRSFFVKHSYLGHLRLHTHDSPYTCETCGKSFISKNGLQVHSILHQDRMPFCCGQCGKEFAQLGNLNKHLSLHTGDKPYPCSYCDKKFVDTSALKRHMVIHTKERIYTCPDCGKSFQHFSTLRSHMTTHRFDDQQQQQQQQLQQQQQQQLEKRMCELCGKSFNTQAAFLSHVRQHRHEEELNNNSNNNNKMYYSANNNINNNNNVEKGYKRFKSDDASYNDNNNIINKMPVANNNINKRPVVVNSINNPNSNNPNNNTNSNNPNNTINTNNNTNDNEEIEYIVYLS